MNAVINKGYHNVAKKSVPCNLIRKIIESKNKLLPKLKHPDLVYYEECKKEYFENLQNGDIEKDTIGECIGFLLSCDYDEEYIHEDVYIYASSRLTDACSYEDRLEYIGLTTLPNGAEAIGLITMSEECNFHIFQLLYFDGEKLQLFTPYEGNAINIVTKTALGNEMYCNFSIMDRNVVLYSIIFPNGIKNHDDLFMDASYYDAEENEEYTISVYDEVLFKYFSYFGIEADILNEFFYELNPECINAEIEECFKALDSSLVKEVI